MIKKKKQTNLATTEQRIALMVTSPFPETSLHEQYRDDGKSSCRHVATMREKVQITADNAYKNNIIMKVVASSSRYIKAMKKNVQLTS